MYMYRYCHMKNKGLVNPHSGLDTQTYGFGLVWAQVCEGQDQTLDSLVTFVKGLSQVTLGYLAPNPYPYHREPYP